MPEPEERVQVEQREDQGALREGLRSPDERAGGGGRARGEAHAHAQGGVQSGTLHYFGVDVGRLPLSVTLLLLLRAGPGTCTFGSWC